MMTENSVSFEFEARYYTIGAKVQDCTEIWFVLHGQGQLAKYFLRKFESIADKRRLIVAPEGLSRYYLDGFYGRVGASWMTKEQRLVDIRNYLNYLNHVYKEVIENCNKQVPTKVTLLGFSQGAATVSRWAQMQEIQFQTLILWAGIFPPDLDYTKGISEFQGKSIYSVYGNQDQFLTDEKLMEQKEISKSLMVDPVEISFDGGHDIDPDTLVELALNSD